MREEASKKASEAAKQQRDLKKFGKQVQVSKIQERQKEKGALFDKIKTLKRSNPSPFLYFSFTSKSCPSIDSNAHVLEHQDGNTLTTEDDFDVELDNAASYGGEKGAKPKMTRDKRNERYGFGGNKRQAKRNDDDVDDFGSGRGGGGRGGFKGREGRGGKGRGNGPPHSPGKQRRMQHKR